MSERLTIEEFKRRLAASALCTTGGVLTDQGREYFQECIAAYRALADELEKMTAGLAAERDTWNDHNKDMCRIEHELREALAASEARVKELEARKRRLDDCAETMTKIVFEHIENMPRQQLELLLLKNNRELLLLREERKALERQARTLHWTTATKALRNCLMLARRKVARLDEAAGWDHIIRFCEEAGVEGDGVLRSDDDN